MPPNLAARNAFYVNYVGTDDPGYNAIGAPWSYKSLGAALTALAGVANPPSATNPWTIAIGPGVLTEAAFELPPWVWICGSADAETGSATEIDVTGDITLHPSWANAAARGGFANLILRPSTGSPRLDLVMPAPISGNPSRVVDLINVRTSLTAILLDASGTADVFRLSQFFQDGASSNSISLSGGTHQWDNVVSAAPITATDTAALALAIGFHSVFLGTGASLAITAANNACTAILAASKLLSLSLTQSGSGTLTTSADAISIPTKGNVTLVGGAAITYFSDATGEGYTPTTPGNWPIVPATVQAALDELAAAGMVTAPNGTAQTTNAAGNTTVTPAAHYWTEKILFTGSAGTQIVILSTAAPPVAGDVISLFIQKTDGGGIVVEVTNATSGGTLLATFADGTGNNTARFDFVYGTIATGYAANAWVAQSYQIPATN